MFLKKVVLYIWGFYVVGGFGCWNWRWLIGGEVKGILRNVLIDFILLFNCLEKCCVFFRILLYLVLISIVLEEIVMFRRIYCSIIRVVIDNFLICIILIIWKIFLIIFWKVLIWLICNDNVKILIYWEMWCDY